MERADFIHMMRLSEHASADDSLAYRRKLALFAALGYRWVVGCILLGIGLARWAFGNLMHDRFRASYIGLQVVVGSLLWASLCSLWVRLPATMLRPVGRRGHLERTLELPVAVLVLWAGYSPTLDDIRKHAFEPVFVRAQR